MSENSPSCSAGAVKRTLNSVFVGFGYKAILAKVESASDFLSWAILGHDGQGPPCGKTLNPITELLPQALCPKICTLPELLPTIALRTRVLELPYTLHNGLP